MNGAIVEWGFLPDSMKADLLLLGGQEFTRYTDAIKAATPQVIKDLTEYFKVKPRGCTGKVSVLPDKEAKSRTFAIVDY